MSTVEMHYVEYNGKYMSKKVICFWLILYDPVTSF